MTVQKETSSGYISVQHAYAFEAGCYRAAEDLVIKFCNDLKAGVDAKSELQDGIAEELKQAYLQGMRSHKAIDIKETSDDL